MLLRQFHKARTDVLELLNFAQDRLKRHEYADLSLKT
jgi:hypothetical protein